MDWTAITHDAITATVGLAGIVVSVFWGRKALALKDQQLTVKDELIKAKDAQLEYLERLAPSQVVDELEGYRVFYEGLLAAERQKHRPLSADDPYIAEVTSRLEAVEQLVTSVNVLSAPPASKTLQSDLTTFIRWRHYRTASGRRPVEDALRSLPDDELAAATAAMRGVQVQGLGVARHLKGDLYELRVDKSRYRLIFAHESRRILLALDFYSRETSKSSDEPFRTAETRLLDWRSRASVGPQPAETSAGHVED